MFRSCRLYSWIRLTCTSNIDSGSTATSVRSIVNLARASLFRLFTASSRSRSEPSSTNSSRRRSSLRSRIQPSPIALVIRWASGRFACRSQRRGVTPFVLLLNRSGQSLAKSGASNFFTSSLCSAATPLTEWLPAIALHDVANGAGHQEVLLQQAQLAARLNGIRRIEDLGDRFGVDLVLHRGDVIAGIEDADVELV